jgi:hypothetical protein
VQLVHPRNKILNMALGWFGPVENVTRLRVKPRAINEQVCLVPSQAGGGIKGYLKLGLVLYRRAKKHLSN